MKSEQQRLIKEAMQVIGEKARTLQESFSKELEYGKIPRELSLFDIIHWESCFRTKHFSLSDRLALFAHSKEKPSPHDLNWQKDLESILLIYNQGIHPEDMLSPHVQTKPFYLALLPFIKYAREKLLNDSSENLIQFTEKGIESNLSHLINRLINISSQAFEEDLKNRTNRDHLRYCQSFYKGHYLTFFQEFSCLARLLTWQTNHWVLSTLTFQKHLKKDQVKIEKIFFKGSKIGKIASISQDQSPSHSPLGPNKIITFSNGSKIVYKTKSGQNDIFYQNLIKWLNSVQKEIQLCAYDVYDQGDHSWHGYVSYANCKDHEEVQDFYNRLGLLTFILQIIGATDYHYGNIISNGGQPILVDHETILNLNTTGWKFNIKESNIIDSHVSNYQLLGAFHFEFLHTSKVVTLSKNSIARKTKKYYWRGKNIPKLLSKRINPYQYTEEIIKGYTFGLDLIIKNQDKFITFLKNQFSSLNINHRFLNRPSLDYLLLLEKSHNPDYLRSGVSRSLLFESLFQFSDDKKINLFNQHMITQEIVQLEQYYWPRFILSKEEEIILGQGHHNELITLSNYIERQVLKSFQFLTQKNNANQTIKILSNYLSSL